jgi:hypothetical protein
MKSDQTVSLFSTTFGALSNNNESLSDSNATFRESARSMLNYASP